MPAVPLHLRALAERAGIISRYVDNDGRTRDTSDETRRRLLACLGFDAADEEAARRTLAGLDLERAARIVDPVLPIAPAACTTLREKVGRRRVFGIWSNLYAVRANNGVGVGNLAHLERLVGFATGAGAEFFGLNPLHALRNRGAEISPYGPLSRLFRNSIYVAPERVPEFAASEEARQLMAAPEFARDLQHARDAERVDYERVASLHGRLMEALWRTFRERASAARARAFERYRTEEDPALGQFATFCTIEEQMARSGKPRDWRQWPAPLRNPESPEVAAFRDRNAERVGFYCFVQFECDRQLRLAARAAKSAGMAIGLYTDMAVGSIASSFDAWAFPGLFVEGACLGAPPDPYSATGQNWGLPPINPHKLRADKYRYWRWMLRAAFRHCGMLRLDHAMGVVRQFWIPAGCSGADGAYVAFPADDLLGLLALESRRNEAVVVAEDLGTVPEGFCDLLERYAILSSNVMFFVRTPKGGFAASTKYSRRALLTANTHDQPTLAGWWKGRDLEIRREVGMISDDTELVEARRARAREKDLLVRRLRSERALERPRDADRPPMLCAAVNRYLAAAPSALLGLSLDDLAAETEPVNVPGITVDRYPSWSRRMHLELEELPNDAGVAQALRGVASRARKPAGGRRRRARKPSAARQLRTRK